MLLTTSGLSLSNVCQEFSYDEHPNIQIRIGDDDDTVNINPERKYLPRMLVEKICKPVKKKCLSLCR